MYELTRCHKPNTYRVFGYDGNTAYPDKLLFEGTLNDALAYLKRQHIADAHKRKRWHRQRLSDQ